MDTEHRSGRLTPVSILHYVRLTYRSILFFTALALYILGRIRHDDLMTHALEKRPAIVLVIWGVFVIEMILRFFPFRLESPGSQKQFAKNYIRSGSTDIQIPDNNATMLIALIWISFNMIFWLLYTAGLFDDGIMLLLCCFYSICDMICILFFCPFQSWFMKNKCCSSCRMYNWDYAMIFTPLAFVRSPYALSLLVLSLALLFRWEITFYRHPERFSEKTNKYLSCDRCTEKLCAHKKQLRSLWKKIAAFTAERTRFLKGM